MVQARGVLVCRKHVNADEAKNQDDLVTIPLDWKTAHLVAGACVVAAELDGTDGNDAAVLRLAADAIAKSIDAAENKSAPGVDTQG